MGLFLVMHSSFLWQRTPLANGEENLYLGLFGISVLILVGQHSSLLKRMIDGAWYHLDV